MLVTSSMHLLLCIHSPFILSFISLSLSLFLGSHFSILLYWTCLLLVSVASVFLSLPLSLFFLQFIIIYQINNDHGYDTNGMINNKHLLFRLVNNNINHICHIVNIEIDLYLTEILHRLLKSLTSTRNIIKQMFRYYTNPMAIRSYI